MRVMQKKSNTVNLHQKWYEIPSLAKTHINQTELKKSKDIRISKFNRQDSFKLFGFERNLEVFISFCLFLK